MYYADAVTNAVTAFTTYSELLTACDGGYAPTIYGRTRRERMLIKLLKADGRKVWGNKGKFW